MKGTGANLRQFGKETTEKDPNTHINQISAR